MRRWRYHFRHVRPTRQQGCAKGFRRMVAGLPQEVILDVIPGIEQPVVDVLESGRLVSENTDKRRIIWPNMQRPLHKSGLICIELRLSRCEELRLQFFHEAERERSLPRDLLVERREIDLGAVLGDRTRSRTDVFLDVREVPRIDHVVDQLRDEGDIIDGRGG